MLQVRLADVRVTLLPKKEEIKAKSVPQNQFGVFLRLNDMFQKRQCLWCFHLERSHKASWKPHKKYTAVSRDTQHWECRIRS